MNPFDELHDQARMDLWRLLGGMVLGFCLFWVGVYFWG